MSKLGRPNFTENTRVNGANISKICLLRQKNRDTIVIKLNRNMCVSIINSLTYIIIHLMLIELPGSKDHSPVKSQLPDQPIEITLEGPLFNQKRLRLI